MNSPVQTGQFWRTGHGPLLLLALLLVGNLALFAVGELLLAPRLSEQESRFLHRQREVRQLLHDQDNAILSPARRFELAGQDLAEFRLAVPPYEEFTGLIEELLVLSGKARLDLTRISYSDESLKKEPQLRIGLSFDLAGEYQQLKEFVHALEQSPRLIAIRQISLQDSDDRAVRLRLSLETWFQRAGETS